MFLLYIDSELVNKNYRPKNFRTTEWRNVAPYVWQHWTLKDVHIVKRFGRKN